MTVAAIYVPKKYEIDSVSAGQTFAIPFPYIASADIRVTITDAVTGVDTDLINTEQGGSGFTATLSPEQITVTGALVIPDQLTIWMDMDFLQPTDYLNTGSWDMEVTETDFDKATLAVQQLKEEVDRAVKVEVTRSETPAALLQSIYDSETAAALSETAAAASETAAAASGASLSTGNLATLSALDPGGFTAGVAVFVNGYATAGDGGGGKFIWSTSDLSTEVTADTQEGIYIAPDSDATGASGAWVRDYTGGISVLWFGAILNDGSDDSASIQAAIDYASTQVTTNGSYPLMTAKVYCPTGRLNVAAAKTLILKKGVSIYGDGSQLSWIYHAGGSVPLFETDMVATDNYWWSISDLSLIGANDGSSTYGVRAHRSNFKCYLLRVNISKFDVNVWLLNCWTFKILKSDINNAVTDNIQIYNGTDMVISNCRVWLAGEHNIYITKAVEELVTPPLSADFQTVTITLRNVLCSQSGKSGMYIVDVININIDGCSFEDNNKDEESWGQIHQEIGGDPTSSILNIDGCYFTSTKRVAETLTNGRAIYAEFDDISVSNCRIVSTSSNGRYEDAIELAAGVDRLTVHNCKISGVITGEYIEVASPTTTVVDITPQLIGTATSTANLNNFDVSTGIGTLIISNSGDIDFSGLTGGRIGDNLNVLKGLNADTITIKHNAGTGDQDIFTNTLQDIVVPSGYGGVTLVCTGTRWNVLTLNNVSSKVTPLDDTGTPSVIGGENFRTGGTTTITDFDYGVLGQTIKIKANHAVTITDGAIIVLNGSANFVMAVGDTLTLTMFDDQVWQETGRMVNL